MIFPSPNIFNKAIPPLPTLLSTIWCLQFPKDLPSGFSLKAYINPWKVGDFQKMPFFFFFFFFFLFSSLSLLVKLLLWLKDKTFFSILELKKTIIIDLKKKSKWTWKRLAKNFSFISPCQTLFTSIRSVHLVSTLAFFIHVNFVCLCIYYISIYLYMHMWICMCVWQRENVSMPKSTDLYLHLHCYHLPLVPPTQYHCHFEFIGQFIKLKLFNFTYRFYYCLYCFQCCCFFFFCLFCFFLNFLSNLTTLQNYFDNSYPTAKLSIVSFFSKLAFLFFFFFLMPLPKYSRNQGV